MTVQRTYVDVGGAASPLRTPYIYRIYINLHLYIDTYTYECMQVSMYVCVRVRVRAYMVGFIIFATMTLNAN